MFAKPMTTFNKKILFKNYNDCIFNFYIQPIRLNNNNISNTQYFQRNMNVRKYTSRNLVKIKLLQHWN